VEKIYTSHSIFEYHYLYSAKSHSNGLKLLKKVLNIEKPQGTTNSHSLQEVGIRADCFGTGCQEYPPVLRGP
jgi:hypothetical protein